MIDLYIYVPDMSARRLVCNDIVIIGVAAAENLLCMCDQAKTTLLLSNLSGCSENLHNSSFQWSENKHEDACTSFDEEWRLLALFCILSPA